MSRAERPLAAHSQAAWDGFRKRVRELGGTLLEPNWLGTNAPHRVTCPNGHECAPRRTSVLDGGHLCRTCSGKNPAVAEAEFRARLVEAGATLLEPKWLGNDKPHRVRCARGHECSPRPKNARKGGEVCRACAGRDSLAAEAEFRARLAEAGATLLEPKWLGCGTPHRVRCAEGHDCAPYPTSLQQGMGVCRACAGRDPLASEARFRARLAELGATLLEPQWLGSDKAHRVRCAEGHLVTPQPKSELRGSGICRICSSKATVLYVVVDDSAEVLKFGITSGDARVRLRRHRRDGFNRVVRLLSGLPAGTALELERAALHGLRAADVTSVRGREYFPLRVLPLVLDLIDNHPAVRPATNA